MGWMGVRRDCIYFLFCKMSTIEDLLNDCSKIDKFTLPSLKETKFELIYLNEKPPVSTNHSPPPFPFANSDVVSTKIVEWRTLSSEVKNAAIYEISLDNEESYFEFSPGDTIGVVARNEEAEIESVIKHLFLQDVADKAYYIKIHEKKVKIPAHLPEESSLRTVLRNCVDLRGVIKKSFLGHLSKHTKDKTEKRVLEYLCSKEGNQAYNNTILGKHFTIVDIFNMFKTCKPPIEVLLANLTRLIPRPYSIANSQLKNKKVIKICFSIKQLSDNRKGLTTGRFERIIHRDITNQIEKLSMDENKMADVIKIHLRKNINGFLMPKELSKPLLLIATGTGIAPFLSFLDERSLYKNNGEIMGDVWLVFGCRHPDSDYIYQRELEEYLTDKVLNKLDLAFSRGDDKSCYVQDILKLKAEKIANFVESGAAVFVCGTKKTMVTQVRETLLSCLVEHSGKSEQDANTYLTEMEKDRRYFVDVWS